MSRRISRERGDPDVRALAAAVRSTAPGLGPATRLVCLDGPSGAGKSTLASRLAKVLRGPGGPAVPIVATDDLLDGWGDQFTFWPRLEQQVLAPLRSGRAGSYRRYDWAAGRFAPDPVAVPLTGVLILEGVSAARAAIRAEASLTVFVTAPPEARQARAQRRDSPAIHPQLARWWLAEEEWFAADATAANVDLVYRTD